MIALVEQYNFRDIGGCNTIDGRRVAMGRVFRSASLSDMGEQHLSHLQRLGIALVVDLRSRAERARAPATHSLPTWTSMEEVSSGDLEAAWRQHSLTSERAIALMEGVYRRLPEEQAEAYGVVFSAIADGTFPVLFHCAAGKDRTGCCAAILLDLLGVPRAAIERDYMQTQKTAARAVLETRSAMARIGVVISDHSALDAVLNPDPAYLDAMFSYLDGHYGSPRIYVERRLGLDASQVDRICDLMLKP